MRRDSKKKNPIAKALRSPHLQQKVHMKESKPRVRLDLRKILDEEED